MTCINRREFKLHKKFHASKYKMVKDTYQVCLSAEKLYIHTHVDTYMALTKNVHLSLRSTGLRLSPSLCAGLITTTIV